jgi:hypothetical protein
MLIVKGLPDHVRGAQIIAEQDTDEMRSKTRRTQNWRNEPSARSKPRHQVKPTTNAKRAKLSHDQAKWVKSSERVECREAERTKNRENEAAIRQNG